MNTNLAVIEASTKLNRLLKYISDDTPLLNISWSSLSFSDFLNIKFFDQVILLNITPDWLFQNDQIVVKNKLKDFSQCILFYSRTDLNTVVQDFINILIRENNNVTGCFELESSTKNYFLIRNYLFQIVKTKNEQNQMKAQLLRMNNQIGEVTHFLNKELLKIKKIHEKVYPSKLTSFRGFKITSKFEAGISSGGEFFDTIKSQNKLLIMMSSCDSYLKSTAILSLFVTLKENKKFDPNLLANFVKEIESQFYQLSTSSSSVKNNALFLMTIDLAKLKVSGYNFGEYTLLRGPGDTHVIGRRLPISYSLMDKAYFEIDLTRGNRLMIISPGLKSNWQRFNMEIPIDIFINDHLDIPGSELINELFYQIKKNIGDDFLERDSSALLVEVEKNAIAEV